MPGIPLAMHDSVGFLCHCHYGRFIRVFIDELFKPNPEKSVNSQECKSDHGEASRLYAVDLAGMVQGRKCCRIIRGTSNSEKAKEIHEKGEMCLAPYLASIDGQHSQPGILTRGPECLVMTGS